MPNLDIHKASLPPDKVKYEPNSFIDNMIIVHRLGFVSVLTFIVILGDKLSRALIKTMKGDHVGHTHEMNHSIEILHDFLRKKFSELFSVGKRQREFEANQQEFLLRGLGIDPLAINEANLNSGDEQD